MFLIALTLGVNKMIDLIDDDANENKIPIINEYVWE